AARRPLGDPLVVLRSGVFAQRARFVDARRPRCGTRRAARDVGGGARQPPAGAEVDSRGGADEMNGRNWAVVASVATVAIAAICIYGARDLPPGGEPGRRQRVAELRGPAELEPPSMTPDGEARAASAAASSAQ